MLETALGSRKVAARGGLFYYPKTRSFIVMKQNSYFKIIPQKINIKTVVFILLFIVVGYFSFKQYSVISCTNISKKHIEERTAAYKEKNFREPKPSTVALAKEEKYISCMRSRGFSQ
jgi:hypothetical protein